MAKYLCTAATKVNVMIQGSYCNFKIAFACDRVRVEHTGTPFRFFFEVQNAILVLFLQCRIFFIGYFLICVAS